LQGTALSVVYIITRSFLLFKLWLRYTLFCAESYISFRRFLYAENVKPCEINNEALQSLFAVRIEIFALAAYNSANETDFKILQRICK